MSVLSQAETIITVLGPLDKTKQILKMIETVSDTLQKIRKKNC